MLQNVLIGTIVPGNVTRQITKECGETWKEVKLVSRGGKIPVWISEYLLDQFKDSTRVAVTGYLSCDYIKSETSKRHLHTFFFVQDIEVVEDDSIEDSNALTIEGTIKRLGAFQAGHHSGKMSLPIVIEYKVGRSKTAVVHVIAVETTARRLRSCNVNDVIVAEGYISPRGEPINVILKNVLSVRSAENGEEGSTDGEV